MNNQKVVPLCAECGSKCVIKLTLIYDIDDIDVRVSEVCDVKNVVSPVECKVKNVLFCSNNQCKERKCMSSYSKTDIICIDKKQKLFKMINEDFKNQ